LGAKTVAKKREWLFFDRHPIPDRLSVGLKDLEADLDAWPDVDAWVGRRRVLGRAFAFWGCVDDEIPDILESVVVPNGFSVYFPSI
jgi:hypothetical protein